MAAPVPPQLDAAAIRILVEEVVRRITARGPATTGAASMAVAPTPQAVTITDAVVSLAHVERLPAGTRELVVSARAVITPAARDRARDAGIAIAREPAPRADAPSAHRIPFVIAHVDGRPEVATRAAAVARAVPRAQRLPATGLADVVSALALHASRDGARGVLLTSRPALAVAVANRAPSLRAVTARDATTLAAAVADCAANLLVVEPTAFAGGLERACADFADRPGGPVPPELAPAAAGCACKGHSPGHSQ
ncbi:MAG: hypothetical protein ACKOZU_07470 [Planctomycetaceae bacterium]